MCPKKLEIDNRSKKTPLIHRFMTPTTLPDAPSPPEEKISPVEENISSAEGNTSSAEGNTSSAEGNGKLIVAEVTKLPEPTINETLPTPSEQSEKPVATVTIDENNDDSVSKTKEDLPKKNAVEVDYKSFITSVQDKINDITSAHFQTQEDLKSQIKAELIEEIKNELKNELRQEIAAKEKAVELKIVREPVKATPPLIEKVGEARYTFRNTMEDIVAEEVTGILKNEKKMCKCTRCVNDICAIVLNSIPSHYVTSEVGQLYDRAGFLDITKLTNLTNNIFKAIDKVKNNPAHPV